MTRARWRSSLLTSVALHLGALLPLVAALGFSDAGLGHDLPSLEVHLSSGGSKATARPRVTGSPQDVTSPAVAAQDSSQPSEGSQEGTQEFGGGHAALDYLGRIASELARSKHYPRAARLQGMEGKVVVEFSIAADGAVDRAELVESSAHELLNRAALDLILAKRRFPSPPQGMTTPLTLRVPIHFRLQDARG